MCSNFSELDPLALEAQAGSDRAFVVIYTTLGPVVVQYVRKTTRLPTALAEDIAQEAWIVVIRKLDDWDPQRGRFVAWVLMIARSQCRGYMRRTRTRRATSLEDEPFDPPSYATAESLSAFEDRQILVEALRELRPQDSELIFLQAVCGLTAPEIAEHVEGNLTPQAIRQRLVQIRKKLKDAIEKGRG